MKLVSFKLENFRAYRKPVEITFNDLTVFIGKNDVGKSTILEALDIFFENRKLESSDVNIEAAKDKENVVFTAAFSEIPDELDLDAGAKTNLEDEYLLNSDKLLEVKKVFTSLTKPKTYLLCNHPCNENASDLHSLNITGLRKRVKDIGVEGDYKANTKNEIRKAIWNDLGDDIKLEDTEIEISQEGVKDIWDKINHELPLFALFQSDRKNDEKDKEIQDPLKFAAEQAFKKHIASLNKIKEEVEKEVAEIANLTIEKLKEMNKEVADKLSPQFPDELKWHSLFTPTLTSDEIPMNKRGSGVRRLLLINFFRAEAERKRLEAEKPNVIYAIEEPETSQHPDWQKKLIIALKKIADDGTAQIITTTHSPALASLIEVEDLRFVYKKDGEIKIEVGREDNIEDISSTLGVLPNLGKDPEQVKVFLCLEGPTDIDFFSNIGPLFGIDIENDPKIIALSLGGGTLEHWVNNNYLKKLKKLEVHIYDKDEDAKYQDFVDEVNNRGLNHYAVLTKKREIENYIHESIVISSFLANDGFTISLVIDDDMDVSSKIAELRHNERHPTKPWADVSARRKKICGDFAKKFLNKETAKLLTLDLLKQRNALDEINGWFEEIKRRMQ